MDRGFALNLIQRLVEIPSVSGDESRLAGCLAGEMERLGYRVHIDGVGNVVGELDRGPGPLTLLLGHMDTVPGRIDVRLEDGRLYGRGAVDAKGPLAAFVCAAAAARVQGRVLVVGAVEEETYGSRGARGLSVRRDPDAVLIGEPSGWSNVVLGYKGQVGVTYTTSRPPRHDAAGGENAAALAVEFWNRLTAHLGAMDPGKSVFHRPTCSLRRLEGDAVRAALHASCRIPPGFDVRELEAFLEAGRGDACLELAGVTPAVVVDRTAPTVRALVGAIRGCGGSPGLRLKTGTSDMNTVSERWRVPMAAYGPGDSRLDHTPGEHLVLGEYLSAIDVLRGALATLTAELAEGCAQSRAQKEGVDEAAAAAESPADEAAFTPEEEEELERRLQALGYLE